MVCGAKLNVTVRSFQLITLLAQTSVPQSGVKCMVTLILYYKLRHLEPEFSLPVAINSNGNKGDGV